MTIRDFRNPYDYDSHGSTVWQHPVVYVAARDRYSNTRNLPVFYETGKVLESKLGCIPILPNEIYKETKLISIGEPEDRALIANNLEALCLFANALVCRSIDIAVRAERAVADVAGIPVFHAVGESTPPPEEWWTITDACQEVTFTDWLKQFRNQVKLTYGLRKDS